MLTIEDALTLVEQRLKETSDMELIVLKDETLSCDFGWVFFYDSRRYLETGDIADAIAGNAPFIVEKATGTIHVTGTAQPIEYYLENFRRFGTPYGPSALKTASDSATEETQIEHG